LYFLSIVPFPGTIAAVQSEPQANSFPLKVECHVREFKSATGRRRQIMTAFTPAESGSQYHMRS